MGEFWVAVVGGVIGGGISALVAIWQTKTTVRAGVQQATQAAEDAKAAARSSIVVTVGTQLLSVLVDLERAVPKIVARRLEAQHSLVQDVREPVRRAQGAWTPSMPGEIRPGGTTSESCSATYCNGTSR